MSLTFKSLSGLQTSNVFDSAAKMVFHSGSQFFNASMDELKTFFTEDVNARIDELGEATNGLPSIWPTARTIALTGLVTGSVAVDGSKNVAIATAIADGALSIAKTAGLATQLQDLRTDVDNIEAAVGDDLQATLDGKADKVHTHLGTESTTVNATYANNLVGVNAAQLGATYGANAVGVVGNDGTGRQVAVFGFGTTANPQLGFRIFNNNAWSPIYQTFHTGNFDPSTKQDLLRNIPIVEIGRGNTTGPTALQLYIGSAAGAWFQKGQGNAALEIGTTSTTGIKLSSGTGGALTFNDLPVYHSGNLNVNTLLKAGDAIKEVFTDTPTAYGSGVSVNFDALPTGRAIIASDANASNPPAAATEWYVETYTTAATQKFQRAVVRGTGEMWARVYTGSAWTAWRRYMDSTNLGTSGYLKTGDFGIGTTGGGFDWANTSPQSQFAVGNAGGPNGAINYMGLRVSMGGSPLYAMSLAARNGRLCFQTIEGGTVGSWFDVHHSGNFDPTSKLDTAVATSYGMGAVPAMATFGAHTLQGLSHAPVLSTASDKPVGISAGTYLAMTMQSGTRTTGALGQLIMAGLNTANPEAYIRTGLSNTYGAWAKLLTSVNTDLSKFLTAGANLDNVINLNTMTSTNYYQQLLDASATAALNYPVTMGGVLIVYTATNGYTHQEYRPRDGSAVWIRSLYSGSWSAWAKQYNSLNFTTTFTAGNGLTGGGDVSANRTITLGTPGTLSGTTTNAVSTASHTHELNMVYNPADQTSTWDSYPQNVVSMGQITAGGPSAASPHITAAFSNGNRVGQLVFDVNGGTGIPNIYYRTHHTSMNGGGWTSFIKVWSEVNQFALGPTQASARTALGLNTAAYQPDTNVPLLSRSMNSIGAAATDWRLTASSAAGSDVLSMRFASGGAYNPSRGAILELNGLNTAADAGAFRLLAAPGSAPRISAGEGSTLTITAGNTGTLALTGTTTVTGTLSTNNSFAFGANSVGLLYQGSTSAASLRVNDGSSGFKYFTFNGATGNIEALNGTFVVGSGKYPVWHSANFDPGQYIQNNAITAADITARTNSGSFQASNPTAGYPENGTSVGWWHMLGTTHNNASNYYALQFSAHFDRPNELWYRNTAGLGTRGWNKIWHSGNMTPLDVNNGGSVLNSLNVYVGAVNTQQRLMNYGYVNGVPRWALAIEADGGLGYYSYNASGAGAKRIMRVSSTLAGGTDEVSVVGTASANKLVVYGTADAHVELQPTGQRAVRFAATSNVGFWDNTNSVWMLRFDTGNTCYMAGNVQATDFILSSDIRLKKDIKPLEFKGRLNPIEYTMAKTGRREMGFSAQDVQKDYPTAVTENEGELGVAYPRLVPVVAAQVNQVEDRVSALEAENVELKDRLAKLEALVAKLVS